MNDPVMKTFRFFLCVFLIFVSIYASLSALNALHERCLPPAENVVRRLFAHVMDILGIPRPKPPWWARLCPLASAVDRNLYMLTNTPYDLQAALAVLVCCLLPTLGLLIGLSRGHQPADPVSSVSPEKEKNLQCPSEASQLEKADTVEEEIYTKCARMLLLVPAAFSYEFPQGSGKGWWFALVFFTDKLDSCDEPDLFTSTYRQLISGPVGKFFDFLKVLISSSLAALSIPESDVSWSYERDGRGNPTLMNAETTDFRVRVICGPFGLDIEVCHLGREVGRAGGNVYRQLEFRLYQATYLGIRQVKEGQMIVYGSGWNLKTAG